MAVSEFSLVTLDGMKSFLNIASTDTEKDAWLEDEIDEMSQSIEQYLDRKIIARRYRKDFNGTDTEILYLEDTPVLQVDSLQIDYDRRFGETSKIQESDFSVFIDRVELFGGYFHVGVKNVRVDYAAGYGELEIPFARTRVDFKETSGGDLLTVYLSGDRSTPTEVADYLEIELNSVGDNERTVRYDYRTRQFTITQTDGVLTLFPSDSDAGFTENDSALPLLGFSGTAFTSSPAVGTTVSFEIPKDLQRAVKDLISNRFDVHYDSSRRGVKSERTGDYQVTYFGTDGNSQLMMSPDVKSVLDRYRRAIYF